MKCTEKLRTLAERGHAGQFRKDGTTPYIEHPRAVVALLEQWGVADDVTLAIAWGHDLLEDTAVTPAEIRRAGGILHGAAILEGIQSLTRDSERWPDKREWLREVARTAGPKALLVKAADRICNTRDFLALGEPDKARDYLADAAPIFALAPETETVAAELELVRAEIDEASEDSPGKRQPIETGITELYFVLDRSGSMEPLVRSTIDGFNEMLRKQKQAAQGELFVSTVLFDDRDTVLHSHIPVADVPVLTRRDYKIGGCTALLDALGGAIEHAIRHQRSAPAVRRAQNVIFVIITDGLENASKRFSRSRIRDLVRRQTDRYDWEFLYMGANIDSFEEAGSLGIHHSHVANWVADATGAGKNFEALSAAMPCCCESTLERKKRFLSGAWKKSIDEDFEARGKK